MLLTLIATMIAPPLHAAESCNPPRRNTAPERYEDFYQLRRRAEARDEEREAAAREIHGREADRQARLEAARQEYVRHRRPKPDDSAGDVAWEAERRARAARIESARECYVTERDRAEAHGRSGRTIPGDVEFGLNE